MAATPRDAGDKPVDTPLGSGPVLAGSGAAALLALRRGAKAAAAPAAAAPAASEASVTADGTIAQWVIKPGTVLGATESKGDDGIAADDLPGWTRVVLLDGEAVATVLRAAE